MPKQKGDFWSEYEVILDFSGKEKYKCKNCSHTWAKNSLHFKEHIEQCKDIYTTDITSKS